MNEIKTKYIISACKIMMQGGQLYRRIHRAWEVLTPLVLDSSLPEDMKSKLSRLDALGMKNSILIESTRYASSRNLTFSEKKEFGEILIQLLYDE